MDNTEQNKIRQLTPEEYKDTYSNFKSPEENATRATELRVFGEVSGHSPDFYQNFIEHFKQEFPGFEKVYAEEFIKAKEYEKKNEWKIDAGKAIIATAGLSTAAGILATAFTSPVNHELPQYPEYPNNPDKQARIELKESPHKTTVAEVKKRLEKRAEQISAERERGYRQTERDRQNARARSQDDTYDKAINNGKEAAEATAKVVGTVSAIKLLLDEKNRRSDTKTRNPDAQTTGLAL